MECNFLRRAPCSKGKTHCCLIGLKGRPPGGITRTSRPCSRKRSSWREGGRAELLLEQLTARRTRRAGMRLSVRRLMDAEGDQIAETVESLAPARLRTNQPKPFPIAKTARIHAQDAADLSSRISLRQAGGPPRECVCGKIMHPLSMPREHVFRVRIAQPVDSARRLPKDDTPVAPRLLAC